MRWSSGGMPTEPSPTSGDAVCVVQLIVGAGEHAVEPKSLGKKYLSTHGRLRCMRSLFILFIVLSATATEPVRICKTNQLFLGDHLIEHTEHLTRCV